MNLRKAAEMALRALENVCLREFLSVPSEELNRQTIKALRQALAQPEQEPEKIVPPVPDYAFDWCNFKKVDLFNDKQEPWQSVQCACGGAIYFKHTKREWVGLTNQERAECWDTVPERAMLKTEAKLKEKNG